MITTLLALGLLLLGIGLVLGWLGTIPTPVPKSMATWARDVTRGSYSLTLWRVFLVIVFLTVALGLILGYGMVGSFIGALILTTLLADTVREWILDLWNANFWRAG